MSEGYGAGTFAEGQRYTPDIIGGRDAELLGQDSAYDKATVLARALDSTSNANHGTANGGVGLTGDRPAAFSEGESLRCDGVDDYLDCGNISSTIFSGDFSVAFFIKLDSVATPTQLPFDKRSGPNAGTSIVCSTSTLQVLVNAESSTVNSFWSAGAWMHCCITRSTTTLTAYKDGSSQAWSTGGTSSSDGSNTNVSRIGARSFTSAVNFVGGLIKDFRVYNDALTAGEVTYLATNGQSGTDPGDANLVGRWGMDRRECEFSTQGNHLAPSGGAVFSTDVPAQLASGKSMKGNGTSAIFDGAYSGQAVDLGDTLTLCAWVRGTTTQCGLFAIAGATAELYLRAAGGGFAALYAQGASNRVTSTISVTDGNWHFIVAESVSGQVASIWVDDVSGGTNDPGVAVSGAVESSRTLAHKVSPSTFWDGEIARPCLFNRQLSDQERTALYNNSSDQPQDYIVGPHDDDPTILDAPPYFPHGSNSLLHDGVDDREERDNFTVGIAYPMSVSAFVKTADAGLSGIYQVADPAAADQYFALAVETSKAASQSRAGGATSAVPSVANANTGAWRHVCAVFTSAADVKNYLDTIEATGTGVTPTGLSKMGIGGFVDSTPGQYIKGQIRDVIIYEKALTPAEVATLANGGTVAGAVAHYPLQTIGTSGPPTPDPDPGIGNIFRRRRLVGARS